MRTSRQFVLGKVTYPISPILLVISGWTREFVDNLLKLALQIMNGDVNSISLSRRIHRQRLLKGFKSLYTSFRY